MPRPRHRAYFAMATAILAVAIGVNLIVFTAVNALWLRPLPFPDADRLVTVPGASVTRLEGGWRDAFNGAIAGQVLSDLEIRPQVRIDGVGRALETVGVTPGFFPLLGLPIRGRDFAPSDDRIGAEPVAIVSHRFWARELDRRADVIGAVLPAQPFPIRIIGVAPAAFDGARRGERTDVWIPTALIRRVVPAKVDWSALPMTVFGRLPPGQSAVDFERHIRETYGGNRGGPPLTVVPLKEVFGTPASPTIVVREGNAVRVVAGLALLVMAGGCAALAALVLVHFERRRGELAVRLAIGSSRARLIRDLARELVVIAAAGTLGALLLATLGLRAIPRLHLPGGVDLSRLDLSIDWRVLAAAAGATLITLLVATWLPIWRFTHGRLAGELLAGPAPTVSAASQRLRQGLLAGLVCASIVVLVAAGLFVRAVNLGFGKAPGFEIERTLFVTAQVISPWADNGPDVMEIVRQRTARVREALRRVPGVETVADGRPPIDPDAAGRIRRPIVIDADGQRHELLVGRLEGSAELLDALGVPLIAGRPLTLADGTAAPMPSVITASLAAKLWPNRTPLGETLTTSWRGGRLLVVGIVPDFVFGSLARPASGVVATASREFNYGIEPRFVVRTQHPEAIAEALHRAVQAELPDAPWVTVATGRELIARDLGRQRLGAWFFSGFGVTALLLGLGGVFGLVAYLAESRRREFGVRLALGATSADLVRHGLRVALVPVAIGVFAGLLCAVWVATLFTSLLNGLSAVDPMTYAGMAALMLGSAAVAALGAAWRLRRVMPTDALRAG